MKPLTYELKEVAPGVVTPVVTEKVMSEIKNIVQKMNERNCKCQYHKE